MKGMWISFISILLLEPVSSLISVSSVLDDRKKGGKKEAKTEYKLPIIETKMTQAGMVYNYAPRT